jgi:hypothetical protein
LEGGPINGSRCDWPSLMRVQGGPKRKGEGALCRPRTMHADRHTVIVSASPQAITLPPPSPPLPQALDTFPGSDEFVVGTDKCDIWKIKFKRSGKELVVGRDGKIEHTSRQMLVKGHADYLRGLDAHPTKCARESPQPVEAALARGTRVGSYFPPAHPSSPGPSPRKLIPSQKWNYK